MSKLPTKGAAKPAAAKSKLPTAAKGSAKPNKALPKPAAAKKQKDPNANIKAGDAIEFTGYVDREDDFTPMFDVGERLVVTEKQKDAEAGLTFFAAVREADYEAYKADPDAVDGDQIFSTEFKKAEKLPEDPFAIAVVEDAGLNEILEANDGDPLAAAKQLQEDVARGTFYLGGALQVLYANRAYLKYGEGEKGGNPYEDDTDEAGNVKKQSGWDKFCRENFNENGRKCYDLIANYRTYVQLLSEEEIADIAADKKIGYVKLAAARNSVTQENVHEVIELARETSVSEFRESIKTDYASGEGGAARTGGGSGSKVKRTRIQLAFFEDQAAGVDLVIAAAKKEFAVEDLNQVFERIIMEWAAQNLGETTFKKARAEKKKVLRGLKSAGVDTSARVEEDAALEGWLARNEGE